ncbi:MAG: 4Fe-4S binding protein [Acholeplasmataceae bacterium]|nr:4Fe-4S binding protein [Acholeplasmataceae bacterium]
MITHIVFSPNGKTFEVASHFHRHLGGTLYDVTLQKDRDRFVFDQVYETAIVFLPVYSQAVPRPMRPFLKALKVKTLILNITYGGISYGNVCLEAKQAINPHFVLGYSITPVTHAYEANQVKIDYLCYQPLIKAIQEQRQGDVPIPFRFKNMFAPVFEKARTNHNIRLTIDHDTCTNCHLCQTLCPVDAIDQDLNITKACIRCARCHHICPEDAISMTPSKSLSFYLRHAKKKTDIIVRHVS